MFKSCLLFIASYVMKLILLEKCHKEHVSTRNFSKFPETENESNSYSIYLTDYQAIEIRCRRIDLWIWNLAFIYNRCLKMTFSYSVIHERRAKYCLKIEIVIENTP